MLSFPQQTQPCPSQAICSPSYISTVKPGPCLHTYVRGVLVTVACDYRQSCCWDTAALHGSGPWHCTGSRGDWQIVFQKASSTSGTAPTDRLQSSPKPSSHQGTPVPRHMEQGKCLEVPMCTCILSLSRLPRLNYNFDFLFLF